MSTPETSKRKLSDLIACNSKIDAGNELTNTNKGSRPRKRKSPEHPCGRSYALSREDDGSHWVFPEVQQDEAFKQWPDRTTAVWSADAFQSGTSSRKRNRLAGEVPVFRSMPAVAHFSTVRFDEENNEVMELGLGDFVEVSYADEGGQDHLGIMEINELFEDSQGDRWFVGHWFYRTGETALAVHNKDLWTNISKQRIFRASAYDNGRDYATVYPFTAIHRKVTVKHIVPGSVPPTDVDYWWEQQHDRRFYTFVDEYPTGCARQSQRTSPQPRTLRCADFYAGCGGLSFVDRQTDRVNITTKWAVDFCESMTLSFRANYPETEVFKTGVDEWLRLCQLFTVLSIKGLRLGDSAERGKSGQSKGCLLESLTASNCWLEVLIKRQGQEAAWEPLHEAQVPDDLLSAFVQKTHQTKAIPIPGDIDVVMGGPPCQGVSGHNRHGARINILEDSRNRQVTAFYSVVDFFKPGFVLMENVVDIFKKEDGTYAKSAMASLLAMRYQVRAGIIAASGYGVPQIRNRVFMWGARSGVEQLPAYPEPSHQGKRSNPNLLKGKHLHVTVDFLSEAQRKAALPMVTMGDILSDLPAVGNFTFAERAEYASAPRTPTQMWLRRHPSSWQASQESRADRAEGFMQEGHAALEEKIRKGENDVGGAERVGKIFACASNTRGHARYAWNRLLKDCKSDSERADRQAELDASQKVLHHQTGLEVLRQFEAARHAGGPVRDHRPLCLNLDDHIRVCSVVKGKGNNFRSLPGVVTHEDGACCAGHWHASIDRHDSGKSACPGSGHWQKPKKSIHKASRVDNNYPETQFPGLSLPGCDAYTVWMPSGGLLCPRWCITFKDGKSTGRTGCFGVVWYDEVQPTVVGRAEPHNLALIHPEQNRVLTIRENARTQGFPDYFALVGVANMSKSWVRNDSLEDRYQQMGNAVCPMVASALGRCLALAALGEGPSSVDEAVVAVPDLEYLQVIEEARNLGLRFYCEQQKVDPLAAVAGGGNADDDDEEVENEEEVEDDESADS
ncbi:hypothetical protein WJX79_004501 [Trebouxia sp. C0005]